jgi:hypothetical protein
MNAISDEITIDLDDLDKNIEDKDKKDKSKVEKEVAEAAPAPETPAKEIVQPEDGLEKLKQQLAAEKSAREEAEARLRESSEAEVRARAESQDSQLHLVKTAIEKIEQQNEVLKGNYAKALADQDYTEAATIQLSMSENSANLVSLRQGKAALEKQPKPQMRAPVDIVEQFVERMTPRSASWVRAHPDYVRDPKKNAKMIAAHNFIKDDVTVDSDEYFSRIEEMLGLKTEAKAPPESKIEELDPMADTAKPVRKAAPPAAPVTRSGTTNGKRANTVTLTSDEREAARDSGLSDEEYARNKIALQKEGRLN